MQIFHPVTRNPYPVTLISMAHFTIMAKLVYNPAIEKTEGAISSAMLYQAHIAQQ